MPGDNYVVNYDINVVSQQAVASIESFVAATKNLQQARNQFNQLNSQINAVNQRFATWSKKAPVIQINTSQAEKKIDRLLGKLTQLETRMKSSGLVAGGVVGGGSSAAAVKGIGGTAVIPGGGRRGGAAGASTQKAQKATNAGKRALISNRGARTGRGNVRYQALGQTLIDTGGVGVFDFVKGMGIAYGIAGIGTLVSNVIKDATEYNNLMQTTKNILGSHDKNPFTFENRFRGMERIIRNVGVETKFTAPEVADASKFLAMAGFDIEAINKSIRPIADIALVGDNDLGETADVVTNIMTGFGISPNQVRRAADIMTMTFTKSNTTLMEIAESYKYAGSLLSRNGTSFEEATAAIGILGDAGIKGSQAGTTLRTMALNIAKPTKAQAEMWERLGISRTDENGRIRPLIELFQELNARNLTLGQFGQLFHKTAASGASALAAHVDKWNEIIEENFMSEGMSARLAEAKKNTIQGLWYQLTSSFTEAGMQAFEDLEGPIKNGLNSVIAGLKSQETIDLIKRFSLTIADLGKTLFDVSGVLIKLYKMFEPIIKLWLKMQLVLSLVLIPLRAVNALLNFGRYIGTNIAKIGQLTVRFNSLGQSMWGVVRANNAMNASAGLGGVAGVPRKHSMAVWGRYARIKARPIIGGAGAMLGGIGGTLLGAKIGEEGSTTSMIGSIVGGGAGMMLGTKLPAILSGLGVAGSVAVGIVGVLVGLIAKMNIETNNAAKAANEWASSFKNLGLEKLNMNTIDGILIGHLRIYTSQLQDQNEKIASSIRLYKEYWAAKNGEEAPIEAGKAFTETASGVFFKEWLENGRKQAALLPVAQTLSKAKIGHLSEQWSLPYRSISDVNAGTTASSQLISRNWEGVDLNVGPAVKIDEKGAALITLARLAADYNNPDRRALEALLTNDILGVNNSALANRYLSDARSTYIQAGDEKLANPRFSDLSSRSWQQIQRTPEYIQWWAPIAEQIMAPYQSLIGAMEEYEKNKTVNTGLLENWFPASLGDASSLILNGFGTEAWIKRINDIYLNPQNYTKFGIESSSDAIKIANGVLDALFAVYNSMNDKFKPLLAGYFAEEAWKGVNFNGLQIPGLGVMNAEGKFEAIKDQFGGSTTPTTTSTTPTGGGNGGYTNQYRSQSATPKQIIVKIENLMNVESVDMGDPNVAATVNNLKQQMAQALIEVVADFDANAANLV